MTKSVKKRTIITIIAITSFALVATFAVGCHKRFNCDNNPERAKKMIAWKVDDLLDEADATDKQRAKFMQAINTIVDDVHKVKSNHKDHHGEMAMELSRQNVDREKIHQMIDSHAEEFKALAHRSADTVLNAWETLSVDQKAELIAEFEKMHGEH